MAMDTAIKKHFGSQLPERQELMCSIHESILQQDKSVVAAIEPMMGKEMILYKDRGFMKYGLSGVKNYMSLHVLTIFGSPSLYSTY